MSYAVRIGTTEAHWIDKASTLVGYVRFDGVLVFHSDGHTSAMVWDDALQNIRAKTAQELAAYQAALDAEAADIATWQPERADFQSQLQTAAARLTQIKDATSMTNVQAVDAIKDTATIVLRLLKYVRRL